MRVVSDSYPEVTSQKVSIRNFVIGCAFVCLQKSASGVLASRMALCFTFQTVNVSLVDSCLTAIWLYNEAWF